jgi:hypothetical protein
MIRACVIDVFGFVMLAVIVTWIARLRSAGRRAKAEQAARLRMAEHHRVMARWNARMPQRHPETPGADDDEARMLDGLVNGADTANPGERP